MATGFRLLRFFSVASLASVVVSVLLLTVLYRELLLDRTVQLSQRNNADLAQSLLSSVHDDLNAYLAAVGNLGAGQAATHTLSERVRDFFDKVMRETSVVRIKVYNDKGVVVFSTDPEQIGADQTMNAGMKSAGSGRIGGGLAYRGAPSLDREVQSDNLFETYVPVRDSPDHPVRGVLEIYTPATPLISQNQRTMMAALIGGGLILLVHYGFLLLAVRRARNIIEAQGLTIRERTAALEKASAELLKTEELEKQKLAAGLHEGLAQTLSAIKVAVERNLDRDAPGRNGGSLDTVVPALQAAIQEVRHIAMELRPASLDDLGLLPTLDWFCREVKLQHPEIVIDRELDLQEHDLPGRLKIVVYRVIESTLKLMSANPDIDRIRLRLRAAERRVTLQIDELRAAALHRPAGRPDSDEEWSSRLAALSERVALLGGRSTVSRNASGGTALRAVWEL
jgi:signal transduction histidine kinase